MANQTNPLGSYLKDCRTRLDPATFGFSGRRRTPGLRREEVAQRANISATWYTWLEQGHGGPPSAAVLDRISKGLMLAEPEREHLFMLALGRLPEVRYKAVDDISPRVQRVLDAMEFSPAIIIKTATWGVVGWNKAAVAVLTDYSKLPRKQRNILRLMFASSRVRDKQEDRQSIARFVVGAFRAGVLRAGAGASEDVSNLVEELCRLSPEFEALWQSNDVVAHAECVKRLHHPEAGLLELEFSTYAVEGRPELVMIVYNPASPADANRVRALILGRES